MSTPTSHGSWPTPFDAARVSSGGTGVSAIGVDGDAVWWSELRPSERGRTQVVRDGEDVLGDGANARTAVHEYGGGAWWVHDGALWWTEWDDQRLRRRDRDGTVTELTDAAPQGGSVRWADGDVHPDGRVALVRETHPVGGGVPDVVNEVVVLHPDGQQEVVVTGPDFVSDPRWSPDGDALAWVEWDHPDMPWDATRLKVRRGDEVVVVAGDQREEGVGQPSWAPDGTLWFCTDREDDWALHSWTPEDGVRRRVALPGDTGAPHWVFGARRFAVLDDGRVVLALRHEGRDRLHLLDGDDATPLPGAAAELTEVADVVTGPAGVVVLGASPWSGNGVLRLDVATGDLERLDRPADLGLPEGWQRDWVRPAQLVGFPGFGGETSYAQLHLPANPDASAPEGELPPLVVMIHGGPTSQASTALNAQRLFWTSRGFAVADVDYAGSTGYGRAYRNRLHGTWGVADVEDCIAVVRHLASEGLVDGSRAVIRGGSAGGYTVLLALTTSDVFAAGADYFGVADAELLAADTHKFESRYLDRLIAPYPEGKETYVARSAVHQLDRISSPLVVLQGDEDKVVPPAQSEAVVSALREKGLPVAYRLYEGEQHGFRRAENVLDSLNSELSFYAQVLGFALPEAEGVPTLEIENLR
jgi:dipeptidyl aminopeptidase/acylaminoacyl peptidase